MMARVARLACLLAALLSVPVVAQKGGRARPFRFLSGIAVVYTDINVGDDAASIVTAAAAGTNFRFKAGTHRHQSIDPKDGDTFTGESGAILSGAKVLPSGSFTFQSTPFTAWKITGQTQAMGTREGQCQTTAEGFPANVPGCTFREELFFDNVRKLHVETSGELVAGAWYFDYSADIIYIADDPNGHTIETSVTTQAFNPTADDVTITNLTIEKYASRAQHGAVESEGGGTGWRITDCIFRYNHGGAIRLGSDGVILRNLFTYQGQIGVIALGTNVLFEDNELSYNNDAFYDQGWEGGGSKFVSTDGLIVRGNFAHHNHGPGLWTDIDNVNCLYEDNVANDNDRNGIYHEIGGACVIRNNETKRNGFEFDDWGFGGGISTQSSDHVEIYGNTVEENADGITGMMKSRGSGVYGTHDLNNLYVHNNLLINNSGWSGVLQDVGDLSYFSSKGNSFASNTLTNTIGNPTPFTWNNGELTEAQFNSAGQSDDAPLLWQLFVRALTRPWTWTRAA